MIRCWHIIALGLLAFCCCASTPALSQGRRAGPPQGQEPLGAYIIQSEEETRRHLQEEAQQSDRLSRVEGRVEQMEGRLAESDASPFGWPTAAAWLGTLVVALVGYLATVRSGRQHAIETEKLRLEFSLMQQRLGVLFARAEALAAVVPDVPHTLEAAVRFFSTMPTAIILLELAAKRVISDRYAEQVYPIVNVVSASCHDLFKLLLAHHPDRASDMDALPKDVVAQIADASHRLSIALSQLMRAADVLAEAALERRDREQYSARLDAICRETQALAAYSRARAHALASRGAEALQELRKAIELNQMWRGSAQTDPAFASLHSDPGFRKLVGLEEEEPGS